MIRFFKKNFCIFSFLIYIESFFQPNKNVFLSELFAFLEFHQKFLHSWGIWVFWTDAGSSKEISSWAKLIMVASFFSLGTFLVRICVHQIHVHIWRTIIFIVMTCWCDTVIPNWRPDLCYICKLCNPSSPESTDIGDMTYDFRLRNKKCFLNKYTGDAV